MTDTQTTQQAPADYEKLNYIESRVKSDGKTPLIAWLLWFFLGAFSAHRIYLKKDFSILMLLLLILAFVLTATFFLAILAPIPFIIYLVIWVKDAINMSDWITEANEDIREKILNDMGA